MAFKKLSECFLYNSINASARTRILAEMGNQSLLSSSTMPEDVINEHLAVITRRYKFSNVIRIVEAIRENKIIPLKDRVIQGVVFRPYRSAWLPGKVKFAGKSENDIVRIPGCCDYRIVEG